MKNITIGILVIALALFGLALAQASIDAPVTTATTLHGAPGNTPGFGGSSASPNGNGKNGGNGIHNIAGGAPGQNGTAGTQDYPPACDMHGGLDTVNQSCPE